MDKSKSLGGNSSIESSLKYLIVLYPVIIRACYLLRQHFEPTYMDSTCLIDLVRVSAPDHYDIHPFWKYFQSNSTCETSTNKPLDVFFTDMYANGRGELTVLNISMAVHTLLGLVYVLSRPFVNRGKSNRSLAGGLAEVFGFILVGLIHSSLFFNFTHYQNDITHLNGNVMHHSDYKVDGQNGSLVGTLPPGLLYLFHLNYYTTGGMMYVLMKRFQLDGKLYLAIGAMVLPLKQLFNMKVIHPYIHTYNRSWYIWPFSMVFKDYEGHVLCHHVNGYCLGDLPGLTYIYDNLMYAHSFIYKLGYVQFQSAPHYVLNIFWDYLLIALTFLCMFVLVFGASFFLPKHVSTNVKGKKVL